MVAIMNNKRIRDNRGISLVDLVIAIAVLALLITPIIIQVAMTLNTSAQAKERQYTVDSATAVMEYFKQSSIDDIKTNKNVSGLVNVDSMVVYNPQDAANKKVCKIYVNGADSGEEVVYNCTDFLLNDVQLGRAKNNYDRAVVMTDLANKLLAKGYRINYEVDLDKTSPTYNNISSNPSFTIQSDHSAVMFDDAGSITRHITAIDCVPVTGSGYVDPNTVSLGNIQDLDSNKVAIIEGDETKLDHKFESDLVSKILDYASRNTGIIDEDLLSNTDNLNTYIANLIRDPHNTFRRMIMISVTRRVPAGSNPVPYYHVDVNVRYYLKFENTSFRVFNGSNEGSLTYEVMNRDFYTSESPDVYMVYEPFIINSNSGDAEYADVDYITIHSDPYTSGQIDGNDPSKIYLVKPKNSWQSVSNAENGLSAYSGDDYEMRKNVYYTLSSSGTYEPVQIVVNQQFKQFELGNGSVTTYSNSDCKPLQIVTNIASYYDATATTDKYKIFSGQFSTTYTAGDEPAFTTSDGTRTDYPGTITDVEKLKDADGNDAETIVCPQEETNLNGKVYNITVTYKNSKGEMVYLTGAKGAD